MAEIKHGTVAVSIPDDMTPPARAGQLTAEEVGRIPKTPRGLGLACDTAADAVEKIGPGFMLPGDITPAGLRAAGERAEKIDQVIHDLEVVLVTLKQANLLFDAEAYRQLRVINDQVKAQSKHDPRIATAFSAVLGYFERPGRPKKEDPKP